SPAVRRAEQRLHLPRVRLPEQRPPGAQAAGFRRGRRRRARLIAVAGRHRDGGILHRDLGLTGRQGSLGAGVKAVRLRPWTRRPVKAIATAPDGKTAASASEDGTVLIWDLTRVEND